MGLFDFFKRKQEEIVQRVLERQNVELLEGEYMDVTSTQFFQELGKYIDVSEWQQRGLVPDEDEDLEYYIYLGDITKKEFRYEEHLLVIGSIKADWINLQENCWFMVTGDVQCQYYTSADNRLDFIEGNLKVDKILDIAFDDNYLGIKGMLNADYLYSGQALIGVVGNMNVRHTHGHVSINSPDQKKASSILPVNEYLQIPKILEGRELPRNYPYGQIYPLDAYANPVFRNPVFWDVYFDLEEDLDYEALNKIWAPLGNHFFINDLDEDESIAEIHFKINDDFELILDSDNMGFSFPELYNIKNDQKLYLSYRFLKFEELLMLCISIRQHDPSWKEGDLPFLLLQPFLIFGENDQQAFDVCTKQSKLILQQLGIHKTYDHLFLEDDKWVKNKAGQWIFDGVLEDDETERTDDRSSDFPHKQWQDLMRTLQSKR